MSLLLPGFNLPAICHKFGASPKVMEMAGQCAKPSELIAQLRADNMGREAVQALSRMMPKEKAVEWAEQSARMSGEQAGLSDDEVTALDAVKTWSANPTEEARTAVSEAAAKLPANSPAMWAANAAAFAKPMPLPEGAVPLPMADDLTAQMAVGSVQLSAAKLSPAGVPELPKIPPMPTVPDMQQIVVEKAKALSAEQQAEATKQLDPFLDMGVKLVESSPGWS